MDVINSAIRYIKRNIPAPILKDAFMGKNHIQVRNRPTNSVDARIREEIIDGQLHEDLSRIGGPQVVIDYDGPIEELDDGTFVIAIPRSLTRNRRIVQVIRVGLDGIQAKSVSHNTLNRSSNATMNAVGGIVAAHSTIPDINTAKVEIIGDNVIRIRDYYFQGGNFLIECLIEFDRNMGELFGPYQSDFNKLCLLATKAYIYNNLALEIDEARISGGRGLARYTQIIESYADTAEMYDSLLEEEWGRILQLNDPGRRESHLLTMGKLTT